MKKKYVVVAGEQTQPPHLLKFANDFTSDTQNNTVTCDLYAASVFDESQLNEFLERFGYMVKYVLPLSKNLPKYITLDDVSEILIKTKKIILW
jgi:hypothetical protein